MGIRKAYASGKNNGVIVFAVRSEGNGKDILRESARINVDNLVERTAKAIAFPENPSNDVVRDGTYKG